MDKELTQKFGNIELTAKQILGLKGIYRAVTVDYDFAGKETWNQYIEHITGFVPKYVRVENKRGNKFYQAIIGEVEGENLIEQLALADCLEQFFKNSSSRGIRFGVSDEMEAEMQKTLENDQ